MTKWTPIPVKSLSRSHLLAAVGGQVEHEHGEEGDAHAGDDEVDGVEERLAPHRHVESDVEVGLLAACVIPETVLEKFDSKRIHSSTSTSIALTLCLHKSF